MSYESDSDEDSFEDAISIFDHWDFVNIVELKPIPETVQNMFFLQSISVADNFVDIKKSIHAVKYELSNVIFEEPLQPYRASFGAAFKSKFHFIDFNHPTVIEAMNRFASAYELHKLGLSNKRSTHVEDSYDSEISSELSEETEELDVELIDNGSGSYLENIPCEYCVGRPYCYGHPLVAEETQQLQLQFNGTNYSSESWGNCGPLVGLDKGLLSFLLGKSFNRSRLIIDQVWNIGVGSCIWFYGKFHYEGIIDDSLKQFIERFSEDLKGKAIGGALHRIMIENEIYLYPVVVESSTGNYLYVLLGNKKKYNWEPSFVVYTPIYDGILKAVFRIIIFIETNFEVRQGAVHVSTGVRYMQYQAYNVYREFVQILRSRITARYYHHGGKQKIPGYQVLKYAGQMYTEDEAINYIMYGAGVMTCELKKIKVRFRNILAKGEENSSEVSYTSVVTNENDHDERKGDQVVRRAYNIMGDQKSNHRIIEHARLAGLVYRIKTISNKFVFTNKGPNGVQVFYGYKKNDDDFNSYYKQEMDIVLSGESLEMRLDYNPSNLGKNSKEKFFSLHNNNMRSKHEDAFYIRVRQSDCRFPWTVVFTTTVFIRVKNPTLRKVGWVDKAPKTTIEEKIEKVGVKMCGASGTENDRAFDQAMEKQMGFWSNIMTRGLSVSAIGEFLKAMSEKLEDEDSTDLD